MFKQLTLDLKTIQPVSFIIFMIQSFLVLFKCKNDRLRKYKQMINKSQVFLKKEMDLQKFIFRQRL